MWALRRVTGRRLWERPWDDELANDAGLDPNANDPSRAAVGATAAANAAVKAPDPALARRPVAPARYVAARHRKREIVASPTPVLDLRRRIQARRPAPVPRRRRVAGLGLVAAALLVVVVALGLLFLPRPPHGQVLDSTGRSQSSQVAIAPTVGATSSPAPSTAPAAADSAAPLSAIVSVTKAAVPGHSYLRVRITWSITDPGSAVRAQLFQWRIDRGDWVTTSLPSSTTRTVALRLPPGHTYAFRVRATDRAGHTGPFASRQIRL